MAFIHGKGTNVWVDAVDLSAFFHSADFGVDVDTAETSTYGSTWKTYLAGLAGGEISLEGYYDPTETTLIDLLPDTANLITIGVGSGAVGGAARLASTITTAYGESAPIGGVVAMTWSLMVNGAAGVKGGRILKPMDTVTAAANGTTVDHGAGSAAAGAVAHLHATAISAGDSIDVTIEDSSTGSSGWATVGTFANLAAPGSERIVIAGTVKRYTRAVWAETNDGSPSYTFAVSLART